MRRTRRASFPFVHGLPASEGKRESGAGMIPSVLALLTVVLFITVGHGRKGKGGIIKIFDPAFFAADRGRAFIRFWFRFSGRIAWLITVILILLSAYFAQCMKHPH